MNGGEDAFPRFFFQISSALTALPSLFSSKNDYNVAGLSISGHGNVLALLLIDRRKLAVHLIFLLVSAILL